MCYNFIVAKSTFRLEWTAHEYEHKERSADWYWAAGIVTAALALASFLFGNVIFGILILLSAFSLALFVNRPPENLPITLSEFGIAKGQTLYPMETLHSFWIDTEHPHKKILLRSQKAMMPLIVIPLSDEVDPERLRQLLLKILPEEYQRLPLLENVLEYLGF